jgi:two-component system, OmpR family, alkaline phosphatase synthesis response regulator PhoP
MARILVVEDHADIAELITHYLQKAGHTPEVITTGTAVVPRLIEAPADLVLLDLMLPGMDGLLVCQAIRQEPKTAATPIVMLTARGEETDRVRGLELGADDYVTKPFSPKELVARVTAHLRRAERTKSAGLEEQPGLRTHTHPAHAQAQGSVITYGPIVIDVERHRITDDGVEVRLTAKEFLLLRYLIEHRGRVLSRDLLLTDVWGYNYTGGTRTVDVHVRRIREKLPILSRAITTIKQFGYKLEETL